MSDLWVTIPTAGRNTLTDCIDSCGIPRDRIILVLTRPNLTAPKGCQTITDLGPINIHRWWNQGIHLAVAQGARHVAVLNDDVLMEPDSLATLHAGMAGATLASPGGRPDAKPTLHTSPSKNTQMVIDGSCWIIDASHGLRADEGYRWWFGDNDLDLRARRDHHGIWIDPVPYAHLHCSELTHASGELQALADQDRLRWELATRGADGS